MSASTRILAAVSYLPLIGWLVAWLAGRKTAFVVFHLRQAIGLVAFLILMLVGWVVVTWLLSWIPYGFLAGNALFPLVIASYAYGLIALVIGIFSALGGRATLLPIFGSFANRLLPVRTSN
jgi:uncharacterized membrane protein